MNQYNENLEQHVIGALLLDPNIRPEFFSIVQTMNIFYFEQNRLIGEVIKAMYDKGEDIDLITIRSALKAAKTLDIVGGMPYVSKCFSQIASAAHWEAHTRILLQLYMKRELYMLGNYTAYESQKEDDVFKLIAHVETGVQGILNQTIVSNEKTIPALLAEEQTRWNQPAGLAGISTGLKVFDMATGGLVKSDLTIIGARPGQGKTALILSIIRNLCNEGHSCGIFSLEMSGPQIIQRLLAQEAQVFGTKIRNVELTDIDRQYLAKASEKISKWNLQINDQAGITMSRLKAKAVMWKRKYDIKAIFVDYLQLMSSEKKSASRESEISEISRGLKVLAKDLNVPVIALSQLSRSVEARANKLPQLSDLRESGQIEADADSVLFLMRPEYYKMNEYDINGANISTVGLAILEAAKLRHGAVGTYALRFDGPFMRFSNYESEPMKPTKTVLSDRYERDENPF